MRFRGVAVLAMAIAAAVSPLGPVTANTASADEYIRRPESDQTGSKPDNWETTYCWSSGFTTSALRTAGTAALNNLDAQTSYYPTFQSSCNSITDVQWRTFSAPNLWGQEACQYYNAAEECEQSFVYLDAGEMSTGHWSASMMQQAACHELGHSIGLTHNTTDCMLTGVTPDGTLRTYSDHHVWHMQHSHDSPFGNLDVATRVPGGIHVQGWALDPDVRTAPAAEVHIYVDNATAYNIGAANVFRNDIQIEYPFWGPSHGFDATVAVGPGPNQVCAYGVNTSYGGASALLACTIVP